MAQLINSIGVPISVNLVSHRFSNLGEKRWLKSGGMVDDIFFISLLNVFVPLLRLIDPLEQFYKFQRWYYSKPKNRLHFHGQKQFNALFANH